jgi:N-hydroxyarylamine O-acetyltransferase
LFDTTLSQRGETESKRELASAGELRRVLHDTFGLALPGQDSDTRREAPAESPAGGLDAVLERIACSSTSTTS